MAIFVFACVGVLFGGFVMGAVALSRSQRAETRADALQRHLRALTERVESLQRRLDSGERSTVPLEAPRETLDFPRAIPSAPAPRATPRIEPLPEPSHLQVTPPPARPSVSPTVARPPRPPRPSLWATLEGALGRASLRRFNLEQLLGGQLFLRAGVAIVLVGVVFLLGYALAQLGPAGRVALGAALGVAMLGGGLFSERRESLRTFGRALIAGGWAILYFVAFAARFLELARVLDSDVVGIGWLLAVAGAAVVFSLRYRSEWTTISAFGLAFAALGLAAAAPNPPYNLSATAIVGAAVAIVAALRHWRRLHVLGAFASWIALAVWMVPESVSRPDAELAALLDSTVVPLSALWLALQLAGLHMQPPGAAADPLVSPGLLANGLGWLGLLLLAARPVGPETQALLALAVGVSELASAAWLYRRGNQMSFRVIVTVALLALGLVTPLRLGADHFAVPLLRLMGVTAVFFAGLWLRDGYLRAIAYLALAGTLLQLAERAAGRAATPELFDPRFIELASATAAPLLLGLALRYLPARWMPAPEAESLRPVAWTVAAGFLAALVFDAVPADSRAFAFAGLAVALAFAAQRGVAAELAWHSAAYVALALVVSLESVESPGGWDRSLASWGLAAAAAAGYCGYGLLAGPRARLPEIVRLWIARASLALAVIAAIAASFALPPRDFSAVTLSALVLAHFVALVRIRWPELYLAAVTMLLSAGCAIGFYSWEVFGSVSELAGHSLSIGPTLLLLFAAHEVLRRDRGDQGFLAVLQLGNALEDARLATLLVPTATLAWFIKAESLAAGANPLVAPLGFAVALIYFELGRSLRSSVWYAHAHALALLAAAHFLAVNSVDVRSAVGVPAGLWALGPALAALVYLLRATPEAAAEIPAPRGLALLTSGYRWAVIALPVTSAFYQVPRAWTVVVLAALALLWLLVWRRARDVDWRAGAIAVVLATVVRALAGNLYFRDEYGGLRLNLVTLPLASALLLSAYVLMRSWDLRGEAPATPRTALGRALDQGRLSWLAGAVAILTGFVWVELEGPLLTVFVSLEGVALVALGFALRERLARLSGLALLVACVSKLLLYDMRGLAGMSRVASFIVLGLVLIAVSFAYNRFKPRLEAGR
jgi:uncharacterized membrane protein